MGAMLRAAGLQLLVVLTLSSWEHAGISCWAASEREADEEEPEDVFDEDIDGELDVDELGDASDEDVSGDEDSQATWSSAEPGGSSINVMPGGAGGEHVSAVISNQMGKMLWIFWRRADSNEETMFKEIPASSTSTLRTYADQVIVLREGPEVSARIAAEFRMTAEDNQNFAVTTDGQAIALENGGKVHVRFFNKGASDLRIFWGNPDDGSELDLGLIQAGGGAYSFNSFAHHEFRLKHGDTAEMVHKLKTTEESEQTYHITEKGVVAASPDDADSTEPDLKEDSEEL